MAQERTDNRHRRSRSGRVAPVELMWPWGHLAVGYLAWSLWSRAMLRRPPRTSEVWVAVAASQLPDLIDKPLAWWFSLLPSGRSLAHSVFALALVSWLALRIARRYDRETLGVAFSVAYASHLLSDAISPIRGGDYHELGYFLWPITPAPFEGTGSIIAFLQSVSIADVTGYHAIALLSGVLLWLFDGAPGLLPGGPDPEPNE